MGVCGCERQRLGEVFGGFRENGRKKTTRSNVPGFDDVEARNSTLRARLAFFFRGDLVRGGLLALLQLLLLLAVFLGELLRLLLMLFL